MFGFKQSLRCQRCLKSERNVNCECWWVKGAQIEVKSCRTNVEKTQTSALSNVAAPPFDLNASQSLGKARTSVSGTEYWHRTTRRQAKMYRLQRLTSLDLPSQLWEQFSVSCFGVMEENVQGFDRIKLISLAVLHRKWIIPL